MLSGRASFSIESDLACQVAVDQRLDWQMAHARTAQRLPGRLNMLQARHARASFSIERDNRCLAIVLVDVFADPVWIIGPVEKVVSGLESKAKMLRKCPDQAKLIAGHAAKDRAHFGA